MTSPAIRRALLRSTLAAQRGRFVAVTFTKRDGSERTMRVQPAAVARRVKGDAASPSAQAATATRKHRHPELLPVYDVAARAIRSINLDTVSRVAAGGEVRTFPPLAEAGA